MKAKQREKHMTSQTKAQTVEYKGFTIKVDAIAEENGYYFDLNRFDYSDSEYNFVSADEAINRAIEIIKEYLYEDF
jgi:hypothetical protein